MKTILKCLALALLLTAAAEPAAALSSLTKEGYGVEIIYSSNTTHTTTHTVTGIMSEFTVTAIGGTADFIFKNSTSTARSSYSGYNVNASSTVTVLAGTFYRNRSMGLVENPIIHVSRVSAATTVYVDIHYLKPRGTTIWP